MCHSQNLDVNDFCFRQELDVGNNRICLVEQTFGTLPSAAKSNRNKAQDLGGELGGELGGLCGGLEALADGTKHMLSNPKSPSSDGNKHRTHMVISMNINRQTLDKNILSTAYFSNPLP